jgi:hypothetical protein
VYGSWEKTEEAPLHFRDSVINLHNWIVASNSLVEQANLFIGYYPTPPQPVAGVSGASYHAIGRGLALRVIDGMRFAAFLAAPQGTPDAVGLDGIDGYAAFLNAGWVNIHHTSKGDQSGKNTTDVGSGAGSQSRAADTHLIIRQHEENDVAVDRTLALLRAMLNKADELGYRGDNPAQGVKMFTEQSRDQFLRPEELEAFFRALALELQLYWMTWNARSISASSKP